MNSVNVIQDNKAQTLEVSNISIKTKREDLIELFREYGKCHVRKSYYQTNAYVEFKEAKDAQEAVSELNGYRFEGSVLKVKKQVKKSYEHVKNGVKEPKIAKKPLLVTFSKPEKPPKKAKNDEYWKQLSNPEKPGHKEESKESKPVSEIDSESTAEEIAPKNKFEKMIKAKVPKKTEKYTEKEATWNMTTKVERGGAKPMNSQTVMKEEVSVNMLRLNEDLAIISEATGNSAKSDKDLDLMFIMDCTGSMGSWISTCQKEIIKIVGKIVDENSGCKVRVSFVGYRDFDMGDRSFSVLDFTEDINGFKNFVNEVRADGGSDEAEDICGGFEKAIKQSWSGNSTKVAMIVADAPCHGREYHNSEETGDRYPGGDTKGRCLRKQTEELASMEVDLYAIKINNSTNTMFRVLNTSYKPIAKKEIQIQALGHSTINFASFVSNSASVSLSLSKTANSSMGNNETHFDMLVKLLANKEKLQEKDKLKNLLKNIKKLSKINLNGPESVEAISQAQNLVQEIECLRKQQREAHEKNATKKSDKNMMNLKYEIDTKRQPAYAEINRARQLATKIVAAQTHSFFIVEEKFGPPVNWKKPLIDSCSMSTKVKIAQKPFSEGSFRYAFHGYDSFLEENMVLKLNKQIDLKQYNVASMSQELEQTSICSLITRKFNERMIDKVSEPHLLRDFVRSFIYEIKEGNSDLKYYFAENLIEGEYKKQNNNGGWISNSCSDESQIAQALSHFSWQLTRGYLLIVDIQGVGNVLTDPLIHCLDQDRFDSGNFGYEGILKFFSTHKCNKYCKDLHLVHPQEKSQVKSDYSFYETKTQLLRPQNMNQKINKLCDLCKHSYETTTGIFYNARVKKAPNWCKNCFEQNKKTRHIGTCIDCNGDIVQSKHWYKMYRSDPHERCYPCRVNLRAKLREELEERID